MISRQKLIGWMLVVVSVAYIAYFLKVRLFTPGPEIKQYADDVADKYDVRRHIRFNTVVQGARWDEDALVWRVGLANGDTVTARAVCDYVAGMTDPFALQEYRRVFHMEFAL